MAGSDKWPIFTFEEPVSAQIFYLLGKKHVKQLLSPFRPHLCPWALGVSPHFGKMDGIE
jgi:hypothetical protein